MTVDLATCTIMCRSSYIVGTCRILKRLRNSAGARIALRRSQPVQQSSQQPASQRPASQQAARRSQQQVLVAETRGWRRHGRADGACWSCKAGGSTTPRRSLAAARMGFRMALVMPRGLMLKHMAFGQALYLFAEVPG